LNKIQLRFNLLNMTKVIPAHLSTFQFTYQDATSALIQFVNLRPEIKTFY